MELTGRSRRSSTASIRRPPIKVVCTAAAGGRDSAATRAAGSSSPIRYPRRRELSGKKASSGAPVHGCAPLVAISSEHRAPVHRRFGRRRSGRWFTKSCCRLSHSGGCERRTAGATVHGMSAALRSDPRRFGWPAFSRRALAYNKAMELTARTWSPHHLLGRSPPASVGA